MSFTWKNKIWASWFHKQKRFIYTDCVYNKSILLIDTCDEEGDLNNLKDFILKDIATGDIKCIPKCPQNAYRAVIMEDEIIVMTFAKTNRISIYSINLKEERSPWRKLKFITSTCQNIIDKGKVKMGTGIREVLPSMHPYGNRLIISFWRKFLIFTRDENKNHIIKINFPDGIGPAQQMVKIKKNLWITTRDDNTIYRVVMEKRSEWQDFTLNLMKEKENQKLNINGLMGYQDFCKHKIFLDRFILLFYGDTDDGKGEWFFYIVDTKENKQYFQNKYSFVYSKEQDNDWDRYGIWINDNFLFGDFVTQGLTRKDACMTNVYDISCFLKNWHVIGHIVLLKELVMRKRAAMRRTTRNNKLGGIIQSLFRVDCDDIFKRTLSFLITKN